MKIVKEGRTGGRHQQNKMPDGVCACFVFSDIK